MKYSRIRHQDSVPALPDIAETRVTAPHARRSARPYFVHEVQFGFMKTLIAAAAAAAAALVVNRAFSSARCTATTIGVHRFVRQISSDYVCTVLTHV